MSQSFWDHPIESLKQAVSIKEQIAALESKLAAIFGGWASSGKKPNNSKGRKTMSAAHRAKLVVAAKARWAKVKGTASKPAKAAKKKRTMSPEARAKIAAAMKAKWAARKKGAAAPNTRKK